MVLNSKNLFVKQACSIVANAILASDGMILRHTRTSWTLECDCKYIWETVFLIFLATNGGVPTSSSDLLDLEQDEEHADNDEQDAGEEDHPGE